MTNPELSLSEIEAHSIAFGAAQDLIRGRRTPPGPTTPDIAGDAERRASLPRATRDIFDVAAADADVAGSRSENRDNSHTASL